MEFTVTIPGKPMGKQRPMVTRRGIAYTPKETVNYESYVKQVYVANNGPNFGDVALAIYIDAYYEIPKSASKKKKALMLSGEIRPTKKPDWDNVGKIICDSLNGIAYHDDSQIIKAIVQKIYAEEPRVNMRISTMFEAYQISPYST